MSEALSAPFADVEAMLSEQTHALLDNVVVTPASGGQPFTAQFDVADRSAFDAAVVGDYTLRYLAADAAGLAQGQVLEIAGASYEVAERPVRINAHEMLVGLIEHDESEPDPEPEAP